MMAYIAILFNKTFIKISARYFILYSYGSFLGEKYYE